jgi:hypothetical protein
MRINLETRRSQAMWADLRTWIGFANENALLPQALRNPSARWLTERGSNLNVEGSSSSERFCCDSSIREFSTTLLLGQAKCSRSSFQRLTREAGGTRLTGEPDRQHAPTENDLAEARGIGSA